MNYAKYTFRIRILNALITLQALDLILFMLSATTQETLFKMSTICYITM
jgi:hypothetical protein